jgi:5-methylcytosine-specific restriction endonuclease McrA
VLPAAVNEILDLKPQLGDLLELLSELTGRSVDENMREIQEHVAARVFFLLLGDISDAPNFEILSGRISRRLGIPASQITSLVEALVQALLNTGASEVGRRRSVRDLPYTSRRELYERQGHRCAVCGWDFRGVPGVDRTEAEAKATLDHVVSYRLGGDYMTNLSIVCGLCNSVKGASIHVGEHGRVWIGNHVYWASERTAAFWTFLRDRRCRRPTCARDASTARLYAVRWENRGPWTLDNLITSCEEHRRVADAVRY